MPAAPKVSVLIPTYRFERYLAEYDNFDYFFICQL